MIQADDIPAGKYGGIGPGLKMIRRMVHHIGGNIRAESILGKGSAFYFTLVFDKF